MKYVIIILLLLQYSFAQLTGVIKGRVVDRDTQEPLIGVNVQIVELELGTITNLDGYYSLERIPAGTRHIAYSIIGYKKQVILNLPITSVRPINLNVELDVEPVEFNEVEVKGNVFGKTSESIISSLNINQVEFKSDPGSGRDVQRTLQTSPSVLQIGDHVNEIVVRGGDQGENLFMMDNIEIGNPNHFGVEGNGGGGFSIVNALFVKNIEFTPGAFSARYGDKVSSSTRIDLREGSRSNYEFDFDVSMSGANLVAEGPINNEKGSFILGSTWSYFDNLITNVGLTSIPHFNHHQLKFVYDLNNRNKLIINGLLGRDRISGLDDNVNKSYYGVTNFNYNNRVSIGGIALKSLLGKSGYGITSLSSYRQRMLVDVFDFELEQYPWYTLDNFISEITIKSEWFLQTPIGKFDTGFSFKNIVYDHKEWLNANISFKYDTTYWVNNEWQLPDSLNKPEEIHPIYYRTTTRHEILTKYQKFGYFLQSKHKILNKIFFTTGIRLDYYTGTDDIVFSPRLNIQYSASPSNTFHIAFGRHYQFPENFMVFRDQINSKLKTEYSDQFVLGFEHFISDDFRTTMELYYKKYNDVYTYYYWSHDPEVYPEQLNHLFHWENNGTKENYGLELLLHKKLSKNWHGIFSYSWNKAMAKDVRTITYVPEPYTFMNDGKWYPWDYDVRHKLTFTGGWKKKFSEYKWYQQLIENNFAKVITPILPIGDELEISIRYSYVSGKPYTEKIYYPEYYSWRVPENTNWNGANFSDYQRLDFRFLKRHHFNKINLVIYINFINILDKNNVLGNIYNQNGTLETVWHFKTLPIGGINLEF